MPLRSQDTAIWNGDHSDDLPVGSSGKVRDLRDGEVYVDWGDGFEDWYDEKLLLTPRQAANHAIEPWASAFSR